MSLSPALRALLGIALLSLSTGILAMRMIIRTSLK